MTEHRHDHNCDERLAQICDYIDGELSADLCRELEKHLASCDDCRVMVDTTRKTVILYRQHYQQTQVALPAGLTDRLKQAMQEAGCADKESPIEGDKE